MENEDLIKFNWTGVSFAQQESKKIIILICSNIESANNLLETLKTNVFGLRVFVREPLKTFCFEIDFQLENILRFDSVFTEENYPPVKWVKLQQLTYITTGYQDDHNKLQLMFPFHPFESNLYLS